MEEQAPYAAANGARNLVNEARAVVNQLGFAASPWGYANRPTYAHLEAWWRAPSGQEFYFSYQFDPSLGLSCCKLQTVWRGRASLCFDGMRVRRERDIRFLLNSALSEARANAPTASVAVAPPLAPAPEAAPTPALAAAAPAPEAAAGNQPPCFVCGCLCPPPAAPAPGSKL